MSFASRLAGAALVTASVTTMATAGPYVTTARATYMATMSASSAAALPTVKSGATAPAEATAIRIAAPIPTWTLPASIIPTVVLATEEELRVFHRRDLDRRDARA
jgi:hypothetical protein